MHRSLQTIWSMWSPSNLLLPLNFPHQVVFIPLNSQTKQTLSSVSSCQVFCHKHKKSNQHKKFYITISYQGLDNKFSNTDLSIVSYIWKKINLKWNYLVNWCCMWNLWYSRNSKIWGDKIGSQKIYTKKLLHGIYNYTQLSLLSTFQTRVMFVKNQLILLNTVLSLKPIVST